MSAKPHFTGADREYGGAMSRFRYSHTAVRLDRSLAEIRPDHPALEEGRTIFPTRVFGPHASGNLLVSGVNNAKVGNFVAKGPWRGFPIYTLTLEERATCPSSCHLWAACYGNAMPLAKRWQYGSAFIERLKSEVNAKAREHPRGFVVRLHVLGDFPDLGYVDSWGQMMAAAEALHVFGYTAHPFDSEVGRGIARLNHVFAGRWAVRFSVAPEHSAAPMQATTIWRRARGQIEEGVVCPASSGDTAACGTCGLCWSEAAAGKRIVFLGHGMNPRGGGRSRKKAPAPTNAVVPFRQPPPAEVPADFIAALDQEIATLERKLSAARALRSAYP